MSSLNDLPCLGCDTQGGCGTGTGNWPKPGDPDNNSVLTATPAFGGVDVEWTYPQTNSHAVAHTRLFRAYSNDFAAASLHEIVGGNFFYDKNTSNVPIEYFYWIQFVSVNGTYGEVIGPVSAIPKPTIDEMLEMLTGKIDSGVLAQSLKSEIDRIEINNRSIIEEADARMQANAALSAALAAMQTNVDSATTYINEEIVNRVNGQDALLQRINALAVGNADMTAAILAEQQARIDGDTALAADILTISVKSDNNAAAIVAERQARIDADSALATDITAMNVKVGDNAAAILNEASVRATADQALATQINQVESTAGDNLAQAKTELQTSISTVDGKVTQIGALWTAKVAVNGLIGGFGVYNDGQTVEAGFDVDRFWVGRTNANKRKPFIIENDVVYIDDAAINKLTFDKLRAADGSLIVSNGKVQAKYLEVDKIVVNEAQSTNYVAGTTGWKFFRDGNFEINGSNSQGRIRMNPQGATIWDQNGVMRVRWGTW